MIATLEQQLQALQLHMPPAPDEPDAESDVDEE
jgi:hypothetical protein